MLLLDPINSITSVSFYRRIFKQKLGRTALYLAYMGAIFAVLATAAMKIRLGPSINETFHWLEKSAPVLTYQNGRFSSISPMPVILRHPEFADVVVEIDTTRTAPVSLQDMKASHAMAFLTATDFYMRRQDGTLEDYHFPKPPDPKPVTIDAAFYRHANRVLNRVLYPLAVVFVFLLFFVWKSLSSLVYSLAALWINMVQKANLPYPHLLNLSVYAQTLVVAIQAIFLFLPARIPLFSVIALFLTGLYLWLAIRTIRTPEAAASPPPAPVS